MIVERLWTGNAYRNFNYLIACPDSGEALAIDPLDHAQCLAKAKERGWPIYGFRFTSRFTRNA